MIFFTPKELNICDEMSFDQIIAYCDIVLQVLNPIRKIAECPVHVNSGWRSIKRNAEIEGAKNSQHMALTKCAAADITIGTKEENRKLCEKIRNSSIPFDQLILEKSGEWIHVSYASDGVIRRQYLELN